jgi:hypothetical protein
MYNHVYTFCTRTAPLWLIMASLSIIGGLWIDDSAILKSVWCVSLRWRTGIVAPVAIADGVCPGPSTGGRAASDGPLVGPPWSLLAPRKGTCSSSCRICCVGSMVGSSRVSSISTGGSFVGGLATGSPVVPTAACAPAVLESGGLSCKEMSLLSSYYKMYYIMIWLYLYMFAGCKYRLHGLTWHCACTVKFAPFLWRNLMTEKTWSKCLCVNI